MRLSVWMEQSYTMITYLGCLGSRLAREEDAQDIIEYALLLAFIVLAGAAAFIGMTDATTGIWNSINSRLSNANE